MTPYEQGYYETLYKLGYEYKEAAGPVVPPQLAGGTAPPDITKRKPVKSGPLLGKPKKAPGVPELSPRKSRGTGALSTVPGRVPGIR